MAPLLRTKPGARTEIAGNNQKLAAIGEPIPEGFIHENPLSHQPIGFSLPDRPKECGLAREILQLTEVPGTRLGLAVRASIVDYLYANGHGLLYGSVE